MEAIIRPEAINILSSDSNTSQYGGKTFSKEKPEEMPKMSAWEKFKAKTREICELLKPVVEVVVPLIKAATMLINSFRSLQDTRHKEARYAFGNY